MTVFKTGLFSAIVTIFIIESYKRLSPEPGERTTALLEQISSQLGGFQNNSFPPSQDSALSPHALAILWVNALWFISLVLSIVSAFNVMLVQQWIRQYHQITQGLSSDQGHVRLFLFIGTQKYGVSNATLLSSLPLHVSVFLFFTGLIIFLFTISHLIATVVAVFVSLFGLWYFVLTILPTIDDLSPCFTPMSDAWWTIWHAFLWIVAQCRHLPLKVRYYCIAPAPDTMGEVDQGVQASLFRACNSIKDTLSRHEQDLSEGLRDSLVRRVLDMPDDGVDKAITWLIQRPVMDDNLSLENLLLDIQPSTLFRLLVSTNDPSIVTLHSRFSRLLSSCTPGTIGFDNLGYKRRLQTCLNSINDIAKVPFKFGTPDPRQSSSVLLDAIWESFANIHVMQPLWDSEDIAIRITARSICALLAVHIVRAGRNGDQEQAWLQHVTHQDLHHIINALENPHIFNSMNIDSFVLGAHFGADLQTKEVVSFAETLAILILTSNPQGNFRDQITNLILRMEGDSIEDHTHVAGQLRTIFRVPQVPPVGGP